MSIRKLALAAALAVGLAYAEPARIVNEAPVIEDGPVKVDEGDVLAYLLRIPEDKRGTFRLSYDRIASVADGLFVQRTLAARARSEGLDKDPLVQRRLQQVQEAFLADYYTDKVAKEVEKIDLELRAREIYKADPESFRKPELFTIQHIVVDYRGRSRAQAKEKAEKIYRDATAGGEDFAQLAARYSDDPRKKSNGGTLEPAKIEAFSDPPSRDAILALKQGEVSQPVETDYGYEIYRLLERKPSYIPKYEDVREQIVALQRERLLKERLEKLSRDIRSTPTVTVHTKNLDALVIPIDEEALKKAQEAAAAKLLESKNPPDPRK
jgi:peptidyl-prolyl cis-trans isomerase C